MKPAALLLSFLTALWLAAGGSPSVAERVRFATNWRAQAEHGGFYHALAEGLYEAEGLDVEIVQGGAMVNGVAQLAVGRIDFLMGSNLIQTFDAVKQGLPSITVAAFFQKDVHCLIAHPGEGNDRWEDLAGATLFIGNAGRRTYFRWLQAEHGFSDRRVRTYTFNSAPFLVNKRAIQQGFATAEPLAIAEALGREPRVYLLADHGWSTYSTTLDARKELAESDPDVVQRFVDASILGWVRYLYGDPAAAHRLIRAENREMSDEQLAYSRGQLLKRGIVDSGVAIEKGIGAIDPDRVTDFYRKMVAAGLYAIDDLDPAAGYTTRFVNRGVGVAERAKLGGSTSDGLP